MWGPFTAYCYRSIIDGIEHIAMVKVCNFCNFDAKKNCLLFSFLLLFFLFFIFYYFLIHWKQNQNKIN
jgi:hypothetical protein